jgi:hypothetical protein
MAVLLVNQSPMNSIMVKLKLSKKAQPMHCELMSLSMRMRVGMRMFVRLFVRLFVRVAHDRGLSFLSVAPNVSTIREINRC